MIHTSCAREAFVRPYARIESRMLTHWQKCELCQPRECEWKFCSSRAGWPASSDEAATTLYDKSISRRRCRSRHG